VKGNSRKEKTEKIFPTMNNIPNNSNITSVNNPINYNTSNVNNYNIHSQPSLYNAPNAIPPISANPLQFMSHYGGEPFHYALTASQIENLQNLIRQFKTLGKRFSESAIPKLIEAHAQNQQLQHSLDGGNTIPGRNMGSGSMSSSTDPTSRSYHPNAVSSSQPISSSSSSAFHSSSNVAPYPSSSFQSVGNNQNVDRSKDPYNRPPIINNPPHHLTSSASSASFGPGSSSSQNSSYPSSSQTIPTSASSSNLVSSMSSGQINSSLPTLSLSWQCFHSLLLFGTSKNMGESAISFPPSVSGAVVHIIVSFFLYSLSFSSLL
jgi:hypothetical protein